MINAMNAPAPSIRDLHLSQIDKAKKEIKRLKDELNIYNPFHWIKIICREDLINEWVKIKLNCERFLHVAEMSDSTQKALVESILKT